MRKIVMHYYVVGGNEVTFNISEEATAEYTSISMTYDLNKYSEEQLYNKMLDDFDAEFDDEIASGLNVLTRQVYKQLGIKEREV